MGEEQQEEAKFTQDDVTAAATRAAAEAGRKARRDADTELAASLGCTVDEAKAILEAHRTADEATKSEAQKERDAAAADRAAAAKERADLAADRLAAKVERKLIAAGVGQGLKDDDDGKKAEAALKRARRLLELTPDADDDTIAAEIAAAKAEVPSLFSPTTGDTTETTTTVQRTGDRPARPGGGAPKTMAELGRAAAEARGWIPPTAA